MSLYVIKNKDGLYWGGDRRNLHFINYINGAKTYSLNDAKKAAERRNCNVVEVDLVPSKVFINSYNLVEI